MTKRWADPEYRARQVARMKAQRHTAKTKRVMAAKKRKWWREYDNPETRRRIGLASKGRPGVRGDKHVNWKGGRWTTKRDGYIFVQVPKDTPGAKCNGTKTTFYMMEHRLIMQTKLGRPLRSNEHVHHRNGVKDDNRPDNLMLVVPAHHFEKITCPHCNNHFYFR